MIGAHAVFARELFWIPPVDESRYEFRISMDFPDSAAKVAETLSTLRFGARKLLSDIGSHRHRLFMYVFFPKHPNLTFWKCPRSQVLCQCGSNWELRGMTFSGTWDPVESLHRISMSQHSWMSSDYCKLIRLRSLVFRLGWNTLNRNRCSWKRFVLHGKSCSDCRRAKALGDSCPTQHLVLCH